MAKNLSIPNWYAIPSHHDLFFNLRIHCGKLRYLVNAAIALNRSRLARKFSCRWVNIGDPLISPQALSHMSVSWDYSTSFPMASTHLRFAHLNAASRTEAVAIAQNLAIL